MDNETVLRIYYEDYVGKHMGCPALKKKYGVDFNEPFARLGLKIRNDQEKNKKFYCNSDYFETIDTQEKAYWLGFIFADGYVSKPEGKKFARFGISLQDGDGGHLEKLRAALESDVPIHHYEVSQGYKVGSKYCRIVISDDKLANDLIKHGCVEHKSNILKPPTNLPYELRRHFIRGYMDGNGSISITNTKYGQSYAIKWAGTDDILLWIMEHLISDGVITRRYPLHKRKKEQIVSSFDFGGNNLSKKFLDYIYKDATVFLDRKHERYIALTNIIKERESRKNNKTRNGVA
jgi:hypothetical protein